ncbi:oligosaccharide flippase family protein [Paenibacillus sp. FSL K6-3182]|uniref:lipopolysaccharide biosynthesis protein n=1 Tax=Paenibacillus sp. FSL K6-3182 TaxID=2921495 RepID=UPI0030CD35F4
MRTSYSIKNLSITLIGQIVAMGIAFPARFVFVKFLGTEYLGINGLFTNIVSVLSFVELGIGSAIIFSLYKPIAENNSYQIKALMNFYKMAYQVIGIVVLVLGLLLLPFLDLIVQDSALQYNLYIIYLLFLLNSVISYFYAYKRSIIIANQKNYIVNSIRYISLISLNVIQMVILITTKNFILFLIVQICLTIIENLIVSRVANKLYPFLKHSCNTKLDVNDKKGIYKNVRALMYHKFGSTVKLSTDSIVISTFIGINWVGLYSNYYLITNAINSILNQVFNSITASVGNLIVSENENNKYRVFENIYFANFWIGGISAICIFQLLNPFVTLWLGKNYLLSENIVLLISITFFVTVMRNSVLTFKNAGGLFTQDKFKPIIEAILNLVLSIYLAGKFGISGVLMGSLLSTVFTSFWIEPYIVYKYIFKKTVTAYFIKYIKYVGILIISTMVSVRFSNLNIQSELYLFLYKLFISLIIPNLIFYFLFKRTIEYIYFSKLISSFINKFKKVIKK